MLDNGNTIRTYQLQDVKKCRSVNFATKSTAIARYNQLSFCKEPYVAQAQTSLKR